VADDPRGTAVSSLPARAAQDAGALKEVASVPHLGPPKAVGLLLASASTLAGNLTLLASVANLIVVEQARHRGVHVGWRDYLKVGLPVTVLTLGIDLTLLGLLE
jgi:Na+/H+ antiporter NhaD/arsenite permease-like protein